jgi:hypothetical protein
MVEAKIQVGSQAIGIDETRKHGTESVGVARIRQKERNYDSGIEGRLRHDQLGTGRDSSLRRNADKLTRQSQSLIAAIHERLTGAALE